MTRRIESWNTIVRESTRAVEGRLPSTDPHL